ncbi:hypothetical protein KSE_64610 [Kitasatospora setae KM-6054]|uniref:Uncharacterized protein n=1 Tax=Kitasatospora setae (strain ATCC 33774 / DSM 43861 / JCM 3304 / KCC A-0304 / NBRC 14216 / KM-6054) TaxID=452652 RepID=E4N236_KITSK|nr:hypothetical protein KSE_64610 [Kitasatospora setae KM-6054]
MALRPYALLPAQYDHRRLLATTVDAWGRALWLIGPEAAPDPGRYERFAARPRRHPYDALLVSVDGAGGAVREQHLYGLGLRVSRLEALPGGRLLLLGPGAPGQPDAQVHGRGGRRRHGFEPGRCVEFAMADRRHHLWFAYGDEGVYGDPLSSDGLVLRDGGGNHRWGYSPPPGVQHIDTVYALNVEDGTAWACSYPAFPLLEARTDGRTTLRRSPVRAPRGLAVHGDEAVLLGGGSRGAAARADRLHRLRLTADEAVPVEEARLTFPNGAPLTRYAKPVGRGGRLYLHGPTARQWFVLEV